MMQQFIQHYPAQRAVDPGKYREYCLNLSLPLNYVAKSPMIFLQDFVLPAMKSTVCSVSKSILMREDLFVQPVKCGSPVIIRKFYGFFMTGKRKKTILLEPCTAKVFELFFTIVYSACAW